MSDEDDRAVRSEPVVTEEGEEVVLRQQNVGPGSQIGGGEFKNVERGKTPDEAADEQRVLAREAPTETDETDDVSVLHRQLLAAWDAQDAKACADLFTADGTLVGVDGSTVDGRAGIRTHLAGVFADHATGTYVAAVRDVRLLSTDVAILRAVTGVVRPGEGDVNRNRIAIQAMVAVKLDGTWQIALVQNTPAAFHGMPTAADALTEELRRLTRSGES